LYFNGNISQGTIGGNDYYELGTAANTGPAANFTRATTGAIARFITDVNEPNHVLIPSGVWTIDVYLSETGGGANHAQILAKLYTYNGSTFTLVATSTMEEITNGNVPDLYTFSISVPNTVTAATARIHIEFDIQNTNGKTVTLYTEDGRIGEVHTTYAIGLSSLNGLTESTQNFAVGTTGTDFAISSTGSTHTFNLPTASASNRGALSSADWSTFNGKQNNIGLTTVGTNLATLPNPSAIRYLRINADNTVSALSLASLKSDLGFNTAVLGADITNATSTGYEDVTGLSFAVTAGKTYKWRATLGYTNSASGTHTFNLPTASAANRGALSSADWSTFNGKQNAVGFTTVGTNLATLPNPSAVRFLRINADNTVTARTAAEMVTDLGITTSSTSILYQFANGDTLAAGATRFGSLFGGSANHNASDAVRRTPMITNGTLTRLYVMTSTAQPATGSLVCTVRKNSVDQALTITIAAGSAAGVFSDLVNSVSVVVGDQMGMKFVNNSTGTSAAILNNQVLLTI